jgi:hypothetical protein
LRQFVEQKFGIKIGHWQYREAEKAVENIILFGKLILE